jgi:integrase
LAAARTWARAQRAAADAARADAGALDPARQRAATRRAARAAGDAPTCAQLFDAFLEDRARRGAKPKTLAEYRRLLGEGARRGGATGPGPLRAAFGARRVADVTRRDVQAFHDAHEAATPTMAWHYVTLLSAAFTFAEAEELIPAGTNPCRRVRRATRTPQRQALREAEYHALGRALDLAARVGLPAAPARQGRARGLSAARRAKLTGRTRGAYMRHAERAPVPQNPVAVALLRFLALSGWRSGEAKGLRWDALDLTRRVAVLADTKTGRSVRPLGAAALAVLTALRAHPLYPAATPYVFPQLDAPGAPIAEVDHVWAAVRHAAGLDAEDRPAAQ